MNIAIVVFSASGNTLKVAKMLEECLNDRLLKVQLVDITRKREYFPEKYTYGILEQLIRPHDLLCIGGPVYSKHLHYNVQNMIKAFPPANKSWGNLAVPFVTWGGVSSGVALQDATRLLQKGGRKVIAGMKILPSHSLSNRFIKPINPGMPGAESMPVIEELADRIAEYGKQKPAEIKDASKEMDYQLIFEKIKANILFREIPTQRYAFPKVVYHHEKCTQCGTCVKGCPVQRLELNESGPTARTNGPECIHCAECFHNCLSDAISFDLQKYKFEQLITQGAEGRGFLANPETPKSGVYPLHVLFRQLLDVYRAYLKFWNLGQGIYCFPIGQHVCWVLPKMNGEKKGARRN